MACTMHAITGSCTASTARSTSVFPAIALPQRLGRSLPATSHGLVRTRFAAQRRSAAVQTSALFGSAKKASKTPVRETIVPDASFAIPGVLATVTAVSAYEGVLPLAAITGVLAAFLAFQATRVKFIFGPDALEVRIGNAESENKFVGGENKWAYDTFTNWEFWWPGFPILVYFKETQTKPEGQIHFFPVIFNGKQVYDVMVERCGSTQTSGPK